MRPPLLFITHRIPFPPNKGDKIRNYHVIRTLSARYDIHLLSFADPDESTEVPSPLAGLCASVALVPAPASRLVSLGKALLGGCSVSEAHYRNSVMKGRIDALVATHGIEDFWVGSSALAPYLFGLKGSRFVDFMDVDSDKWRQYADRTGNPLTRWVYRREARLVATLETRAVDALDAVFVVAQGERDLLVSRLGERGRVVVAGNGVADVCPGPVPLPERAEEMLFLGAMDYRPNVDAVCWFVERVWPQVLLARPAAQFLIVGSNPTGPVQALREVAGVTVTGTVPEVTPYLDRARLMVAPLRMARGIQNKVLEGMAAGLAVITTPEGADGLDAVDAEHFLVCSDPDVTADAVIRLLSDPKAAAALGNRARRLVEASYSWESRLQPVLDVVSPTAYTEPSQWIEAAV